MILFCFHFCGLSNRVIRKPIQLLETGASLTLKVLITTAVDDIWKYLLYFSEKIRFDRQTSHMKCQALFSLKSNKINFRTLLQHYLALQWLSQTTVIAYFDLIRVWVTKRGSKNV